jgi:hypothetical protein
VWALSALHSHSHYWPCYLGNTRVTATQFWCRLVISSVIKSGFILQSFILHSYFTYFLPAFFHLSILILPLNSQLSTYKDFFNFDGGGNRSARRKSPERDPRQKSFTSHLVREVCQPSARSIRLLHGCVHMNCQSIHVFCSWLQQGACSPSTPVALPLTATCSSWMIRAQPSGRTVAGSVRLSASRVLSVSTRYQYG